MFDEQRDKIVSLCLHQDKLCVPIICQALGTAFYTYDLKSSQQPCKDRVPKKWSNLPQIGQRVGMEIGL